MTLATNVADLAVRAATEDKALRTLLCANAPDLSALDTTAKTDLVSAINELSGSVGGASGINDATTSTTSSWSSQKVSTELADKAELAHSHGVADLPVAASGVSSSTALVRADDTRLSNARTPTAHAHAVGDTTGLQSALDGKAATAHGHAIGDLPVAASGSTSTTALVRADDSRLSNSRAPTAHVHGIADLPVAASGSSSSTQVVRADDLRLSDSRAPTAHGHTTAEVTGLTTALAGKAAVAHAHATTDVTGLQGYVDGRIGTVLDTAGAPAALDTLNELAAAIGDDANFAGTVTAALGNRLRIDAAQGLTGPQQTQGRTNIGAAAAADLTTLTTNVGSTTTDFVAAYEAALV